MEPKKFNLGSKQELMEHGMCDSNPRGLSTTDLAVFCKQHYRSEKDVT